MIYYVGLNGKDDGAWGLSATKPWRTLTYAIWRVKDDGSTILLLPGTYTNPEWRISRAFNNVVTIKAAQPWTARLTNTGGYEALRGFGGAHYYLEGLVLGLTKSRQQVQIGNGVGYHFRECIFQDSYNNDLMKLTLLADSVVEYCCFYNAGASDESIDIQSTRLLIRRCLFFHDYAGSGRAIPATRSQIVIKKHATDIKVIESVFLNWQGKDSADFIRIGEDAWTDRFEAERIEVLDNVFIGNSPRRIEAPVMIENSKDVVVRGNRLVGPMPRKLDITARPRGYKIENITIVDNPWLSPITQPIVLPRWNPTTKKLRSGLGSIKEERSRLLALIA